MPLPMKVLSLALLPLLWPALMLAADPIKPKPDAKAGKGNALPIASAASALDNMAAMIPLGLRNLKVRIPGFEQGRPTSLVIADAMTRQTDKALFAEGVVLHLYTEDPRENLRVDMKSATYHLDTKILTSDERTKVSRADFQMEGDSMVFDTATSTGTMKGHVRTVIFDTSTFAPKKEAPTTTEAPAPALPASPPTKPTSAP